MVALMIILCVVFLTLSVFLIAKFGIKHNDNVEYLNSESTPVDNKQRKF